MAKRSGISNTDPDNTTLDIDPDGDDETIGHTHTHQVPYPNTVERREYFKENSHPVPYPKDEKPYDDSY